MIMKKKTLSFVLIAGLFVSGITVAQTNRVVNSGFETETGGLAGYYWAGGVYLANDNGPSAPGSSAVELASGGILRTGRIPVRPGKTYKARFDYLVPDATAGSWLRGYDSAGTFLGDVGAGQYLYSTSGAWAVHNTLVSNPIPANVAYIDFYVDWVSSSSPIRIDNLLIYEDDNLVGNPEFETGDLTSWYYYPGASVISDPNAPSNPGLYAVQLCGNDGVISSYYVSASEGDTFAVSWDYFVETGGQLWGAFRYFDESSGFLGQDEFWHGPHPTWQVRSFTSSTAPAGTAYMNVILQTTTEACAKVDNVSVRKVVTKASAEPMNYNHDFEEGLVNWYYSGSLDIDAIDSIDSYEYGTKCARLIRTDDPGDSGDLQSPTLLVDPDDCLAASFAYKTAAGATGVPRVTLRYYDENMAWMQDIDAWSLAPTNGEWFEVPTLYLKSLPEGTRAVAIRIVVDQSWGDFVGTLLIDNVKIINMAQNGDCDCDLDVDDVDFGLLVWQWLNDNIDSSPSEPNRVIDDFESYADQNALDASWEMASGSYANTGTGSLSLTSEAYEGSQSLRFMYDNTDPGDGRDSTWTAFHHLFTTPLDLSKYDEMRVRMKRQAGNSEESLLAFSIYNGGTTETDIQARHWLYHEEGSTYADPDQWVEWVVTLNRPDTNFFYGSTMMQDLTDARGIFFSAIGIGDQGEGTGTIDFDRIVFVDNLPGCTGSPEYDFNDDCIVDLGDLAIMADNWLGVF